MAQDNHSEHHIVPASKLTSTLGWLVALTVLTVVTAKTFNLGVLAGPVAFLIAGTKAYLVMSFFMGLKYDAKENRIIFSTGFIFLAVLFFFCALDIFTRVAQTSTL